MPASAQAIAVISRSPEPSPVQRDRKSAACYLCHLLSIFVPLRVVGEVFENFPGKPRTAILDETPTIRLFHRKSEGDWGETEAILNDSAIGYTR